MANKSADLSGTWTWIVKGRKGLPDRTLTAVFKLDGNKLTGSVSAPSSAGGTLTSEIRDGVVNGENISFQSFRVNDGQEVKVRYSGKLSGDSITGQRIFLLHSEEVTTPWSAKKK